MQSIDVHDLPEPVAQEVAATVQALREQFNKNGKNVAQFPVWSLGCTGTLGRDELYEDYLARKIEARPS